MDTLQMTLPQAALILVEMYKEIQGKERRKAWRKTEGPIPIRLSPEERTAFEIIASAFPPEGIKSYADTLFEKKREERIRSARSCGAFGEITNLDAPDETMRKLRRSGFHRIEDLAIMSSAELLQIRGMGQKKVGDVITAIEAYSKKEADRLKLAHRWAWRREQRNEASRSESTIFDSTDSAETAI